jgi:hypothetical protein
MPADSGKYPARIAPWEWHDAGTIDVLDDDGAVASTLDEWQTLVFHAADADRTVGEIIGALRERPPVDDEGRAVDPTPSVMAALNTLTDELGVVALWDTSEDLAFEHDLPAAKRAALESDG